MVLVRFLYGSSKNTQRCVLQTTRMNDGGITVAHDATTDGYGASKLKRHGQCFH